MNEIIKLEIGLDFDGVVFNTDKLKSQLIEKEHKLLLAPWQCRKKFIEKTGLNLDHYNKIKELIYETSVGLWIEPREGAINSIKDIQRKGHKIKIITSRSKKSARIARELLVKYDLEIELISVGNSETSDKSEMAKGLDIYIDDDLSKLEPLRDLVKRVLLFSDVHNREEQLFWIRRVFSWKEIIDMVDEVKKIKI